MTAVTKKKCKFERDLSLGGVVEVRFFVDATIH